MIADHPTGLVPDHCIAADPCVTRVAMAARGVELLLGASGWWRREDGGRSLVEDGHCPWCGKGLGDAHEAAGTAAGLGAPSAVVGATAGLVGVGGGAS